MASAQAPGGGLRVRQLRQVATVRGARAPRAVFDSVSFSVAPGERVALVWAGPGGAEPAEQLARTVALIERPAGGQVELDGRLVSRAWGGQLRALRRQIQYVGGEPRRALSPRLSVADLLAEPLRVHRLGSAAQQRQRVAALGAAWGLNPHVLGQRSGALSAGLCQRVVLARALALAPRLLVTGPLTSHLEPSAAGPLLADLVAALAAIDAAWLWVTTDGELAGQFAQRVLVLADGRLGES